MRVLVVALIAVVVIPAGAAAQGSTQAPPRVIRLYVSEGKFSPSLITIKAGEAIRLELQNVGRRDHQFRSTIFRGIDVYVRTRGFDTRSERMKVIYVRPNGFATIEFVRRKPGEYEFWCAETTNGQSHKDLGEVGKFVVTP